MERLNINQTAILLDWPKDRCRYHFGKIEKIPGHLYDHDKKTGEQSLASTNRINRDWLIPIEKIEDQVGIKIYPLIKDVQQNFTKNKACMDYVMKHIQNKIKQNKDGFYPLTISLPKDVAFLITSYQYKEIIDRVPSYLTADQLFIIKENNIRII